MEISLLSITATLLIGAGCFALGYVLSDSGNYSWKFAWMKKRREAEAPEEADGEGDGPRKRRPKVDQSKGAHVEIENLAEVIEDFKMVLVVRNDLKMGKGKIAAQCSHATLGLYKKLHNRAPKALARWEMCGQVKVVVKIESEEELLVLQARAKSLKLPNHVTVDAGRTQIAPNSRTVMAILGPSEMVDDVTGGLKLL